MFDIGFSELMVIGIVALLVLGPERLPKAAQFVGLWVRRARAQWNSVKSEFERDLASDELKRSLQETRESLRQAEEQIRGSAAALQTQIESGFDDAAAAIPPAPAPDHAHAVAEAAEAGATPDAESAHAEHVFPDEHGEAPLESSREPLYEPPPPDDLDDDDAPPPQHADDAHAGR